MEQPQPPRTLRGVLELNFAWAWVAGGVMALATALIAAIAELPVLDPDAVVAGVPAYVRMPAIVLGAIALDIIGVTLWRAWRDREERRGLQWREVTRDRWQRTHLLFALSGVGAWYLTYATFRNLKSYVPFVNHHNWDAEMRKVDEWLWFGHDPAQVMHDLLGTGWAAHFFSGVYVVWIVLVPASIAIALVFVRNRPASSWYVTAVAFDWMLGAAVYFALPSLGPVFTEAQRGQFADLPQTYNTHLVEVLWTDRVAVVSDVFGAGTLQTIAAFPSLHCGIMVTICLVAEYVGLPRWLRTLAWAFLVLTMLSTLYLGWHYFVDVLGGAAIGSFAVWAAAMATGNRVGLRPRLMRSEPADSETVSA
ncbi:phosphatase PAP2 family protein [Nocardioides litoris]|uniref:phosphatase PAP2 family protein n=1 Tax=Nocardioides litoris TaxID=1926648 RepID=UPI00111E01BA|nr:phosphatase PAP2 family protein [Nocardioides litoris]